MVPLATPDIEMFETDSKELDWPLKEQINNNDIRFELMVIIAVYSHKGQAILCFGKC